MSLGCRPSGIGRYFLRQIRTNVPLPGSTKQRVVPASAKRSKQLGESRLGGISLGILRVHPHDISVRHRLKKKEENMKASILSVALLIGISVAAWTSEATARRGWRQQDKVRTNCLLQALQSYPVSTAGTKLKAKRSASYKACMTAAGRRP
jgi:hypothetical protein